MDVFMSFKLESDLIDRTNETDAVIAVVHGFEGTDAAQIHLEAIGVLA